MFIQSGLAKVRLLHRAPSACPSDLHPTQPLFVIGDVHGRLDLLDALLARIFAEAALMSDMRLIFVGDCIDRGPQSADVIACLRALCDNPAISITCLRGNHEAMMLAFLDDPLSGARWIGHGGRATVQSYGLPDPGPEPGETELAALRDRLRAALPDGEEAFLRSLQFCHLNGNVFVSHAGANPERGLAAQDETSLIWGHPAFLHKRRTDDAWIVHGHVIEPHAAAHGRRIGVDTGAYISNRLSAARILPGALGFVVV